MELGKAQRCAWGPCSAQEPAGAAATGPVAASRWRSPGLSSLTTPGLPPTPGGVARAVSRLSLYKRLYGGKPCDAERR